LVIAAVVRAGLRLGFRHVHSYARRRP
jgi:hypothetical protein